MRNSAAALAKAFVSRRRSQARLTGSIARSDSNTVTFTPQPPTDSSAPDITSVTVSNDNSGLVTFQIRVPNRPQFTSDMEIYLYLDTDRNPSTGGPPRFLAGPCNQGVGAEYLIDLAPDNAYPPGLGRWNGRAYDLGAYPPASLTFAYTTGLATVTISANDLGTSAFNFAVDVVSGYGGTPQDQIVGHEHHDCVPSAGQAWSYQVLTSASQPTMSPAPTFSEITPGDGATVHQGLSLPGVQNALQYLNGRSGNINHTSATKTLSLAGVKPITVSAQIANANTRPTVTIDGKTVNALCDTPRQVYVEQYFPSGRHTVTIIATNGSRQTTKTWSFNVKYTAAALTLGWGAQQSGLAAAAERLAARLIGVSVGVFKKATALLSVVWDVLDNPLPVGSC